MGLEGIAEAMQGVGRVPRRRPSAGLGAGAARGSCAVLRRCACMLASAHAAFEAGRLRARVDSPAGCSPVRAAPTFSETRLHA